ncbi:hypothetical protein PIB30_036721 [Stylosanthes scabra]|uniref:C2H2-type domain-containing protein n=1 Tax=Stylosanthes scabra TaxID=79078 RepID=A0ABU6QD45_9FABA|nr:hypothetical protein [Stylosanthes scabra]
MNSSEKEVVVVEERNNNNDEEVEVEEEEEEEEAQDHRHGTNKKSYDCTFCRRGFTNAQALGGHMNIHRKDRVKNKNHLLHSSNNHQHREFLALKFSSSSSSTHTYSYSAFDSQRNYADHMYFHPPPSPAPPPPPAPYNYVIRNQQYAPPPFQLDQFHGSMMMNLKKQELQGANLSLQICPTAGDDDGHVSRRRNQQKDNKSDEVDLELRLGHHDP